MWFECAEQPFVVGGTLRGETNNIQDLCEQMISGNFSRKISNNIFRPTHLSTTLPQSVFQIKMKYYSVI